MAIFANLPLPLFPIQILWINLVTDGVQDKTFPFIKEEGDVMVRKPKKIQSQFFDTVQIIRIFTFGLVMGIGTFFLFKHLISKYSYELAVTITFTSVVMSQWFNGIQAQKEKEPFFYRLKKSFTINPYIFLAVGGGLLLQLFAIYVAKDWFHTTPMSLNEWKYPLFAALFGFSVVEIRKWVEFFFKRL